jgi:hypothetical protein
MGERFADRDFVALSFVLLRRLDREVGTEVSAGFDDGCDRD